MLIDPRGMFMPAIPPSMRRDPSVTATPVRDRGVTTGYILMAALSGPSRTVSTRTAAILSNNGGAR